MPHPDRAFWTPTEQRNHAKRVRSHCPELAEAVGMLMRLWRWRSAMTLADVAARMGSHRPVVGRLESGLHTPSVDSLFRYARATGGDVAQAFALVDAWFGFPQRRTD